MVHLNRIPRRSISGMLLFGSCPAKCHYPAECIRLGVLLVNTKVTKIDQDADQTLTKPMIRLECDRRKESRKSVSSSLSSPLLLSWRNVSLVSYCIHCIDIVRLSGSLSLCVELNPFLSAHCCSPAFWAVTGPSFIVPGTVRSRVRQQSHRKQHFSRRLSPSFRRISSRTTPPTSKF